MLLLPKLKSFSTLETTSPSVLPVVNITDAQLSPLSMPEILISSPNEMIRLFKLILIIFHNQLFINHSQKPITVFLFCSLKKISIYLMNGRVFSIFISYVIWFTYLIDYMIKWIECIKYFKLLKEINFIQSVIKRDSNKKKDA